MLCICGKRAHHLKGVVDSEKRNVLITGFQWQGLKSILIGNSPVG